MRRFCGILCAPVVIVCTNGAVGNDSFLSCFLCLAVLLQLRSFRLVDVVLLSLCYYGMNDGQVLGVTFPVVVEMWVGRGNI